MFNGVAAGGVVQRLPLSFDNVLQRRVAENPRTLFMQIAAKYTPLWV
jgi:hypothetical protein